MFENVSAKQLARAAQLKEQIENLEAELEQLIGQGNAQISIVSSGPVRSAGKGGISAEGRARIIAAQKARWAKFRGEKASDGTTATAGAKPKRTMSPAAKAKIAAAARARWKKAKAAGKSSL